MDKELILKERVRQACRDCPYLRETGKDPGTVLLAVARGNYRRVDLKPYAMYCHSELNRYRKVANKWDYTGDTPKWCPRLEANQ